ncbi:hypothetical protein FA95DRAFT_992782 [Auriscalpium vulgare]|uniref:Uncharacterized protein n=1 Tax=Auriscalpium vulgare TaxID=40419 RepID=A0ACB8R6B9_9AGAM|nr:hypothetical protein FA95DRAFT_992782 [Auriscalpium vulgare]
MTSVAARHHATGCHPMRTARCCNCLLRAAFEALIASAVSAVCIRAKFSEKARIRQERMQQYPLSGRRQSDRGDSVSTGHRVRREKKQQAPPGDRISSVSCRATSWHSPRPLHCAASPGADRGAGPAAESRRARFKSSR